MFILPSRGRPHNMRRFLDAALQTGQKMSMLVYLDEDDPGLEEYKQIEYPPSWSVHTRPPVGLGGIYHWVFKNFPQEKFYGFLADDLIPRTDNWDEKLVTAAGDWNVAYGDDGLQGERLATHPCIGGELVRKMGWLAYPGLERLFIDTTWHVIGAMRGALRYLPEVKLEHMHYLNGKAPHDATYGDQSKAFMADRERFSQFLYEQQDTWTHC